MAQVNAKPSSKSLEELLGECAEVLRENQRTLKSVDERLRKLTVILSNR